MPPRDFVSGRNPCGGNNEGYRFPVEELNIDLLIRHTPFPSDAIDVACFPVPPLACTLCRSLYNILQCLFCGENYLIACQSNQEIKYQYSETCIKRIPSGNAVVSAEYRVSAYYMFR